MNGSASFRSLQIKVKMAPSRLKQINCFNCINVETDDIYCFLQFMQHGFDLGRYIYE